MISSALTHWQRKRRRCCLVQEKLGGDGPHSHLPFFPGFVRSGDQQAAARRRQVTVSHIASELFCTKNSTDVFSVANELRLKKSWMMPTRFDLRD